MNNETLRIANAIDARIRTLNSYISDMEIFNLPFSALPSKDDPLGLKGIVDPAIVERFKADAIDDLKAQRDMLYVELGNL